MSPLLIMNITPSVILKVRRALRTACEQTDSVLALYAIDEWREFYGNNGFLPPTLPFVASTVPSRETVRSQGCRTEAICQRVRLTGGLYKHSALWVISPGADLQECEVAFREATESIEDVIFPLLER